MLRPRKFCPRAKACGIWPRRCAGAGLELLPVTIVTQTERQWETGELFEIPELQASFERYLRHYGLSDVRCRVLVDEQGSQASAVRALLNLAAEEDAEWITVSSHGRHGVSRFLRGSFAERLVGLSPWPVLFLPPRAGAAKSIRPARGLIPYRPRRGSARRVRAVPRHGFAPSPGGRDLPRRLLPRANVRLWPGPRRPRAPAPPKITSKTAPRTRALSGSSWCMKRGRAACARVW